MSEKSDHNETNSTQATRTMDTHKWQHKEGEWWCKDWQKQQQNQQCENQQAMTSDKWQKRVTTWQASTPTSDQEDNV